MSSIWDWSITPANNATADTSINWQEGQAPSTVNNSARVMMERVAELLDDIGGLAAVSGTANVISITTASPFSAYVNGMIVAFKAGANNTTAVTLNANAVGAKPLSKFAAAGEVSLAQGDIFIGGTYLARYDTALASGAGGFALMNPAGITATPTFTSVTSGTGSFTTSLTVAGGSAGAPGFRFSGATTTGFYNTGTTEVKVAVAGAARANFAGDGLHVGKLSGSLTTDGISSFYTGLFQAAATSFIVAQFSRNSSDGTIVEWMRDGVAQGSITVAGGVVSYNTFFGSHWSQLGDGGRQEILRGTVIESIDAMCEWPNEGNINLPKFKVSDTVASTSVYGVFSSWDDDYTETNDAYIGALGTYVIRIASGISVSRGDFLESNGDGCARSQGDTIFKASTIAKVTSGTIIESYADGSYLVPCTLHCG